MTLPLHARLGHVTSDPALCLPGRGAPSPACASAVQAGAFLDTAALTAPLFTQGETDDEAHI
jgi:hypothetical protein